MRVLASLILAAGLAGCAAMALNDSVRIDPSTAPGATYQVSFLNVWDFAYDGDAPADRQRVTKSLLESPECKAPHMVGDERALRMGSYATGGARITYVSNWAC